MVAQNRLVADRLNVTNVYSLLALLSLAVFGLLHIVAEHNPLLGYLEIAGGLTVALNLGALRLTHNVTLARNSLVLIILAMLLVMLATGGTARTGIFWFFVFPVSAFFLTGKKAGLWWVTCLVAAVVGILLLQQAGIIGISYSVLEVRQLLVSFLVVSIGIYVYQQSREKLVLEAQESQQVSNEEKIKAETIVENIDEGVVAVDQSGRVKLMNEAAEAMLGWKRAGLIGQKFVDTISMLDTHGNPIGIGEGPLQHILQRPRIVYEGVTYVRKDGSKFPAVISGRSVVVNGKVHGAIIAFRDITREQAVDRTKSEFVTLASHQLRTPISAIAWVSELLLAGDVGKLTLEQLEYIKQIYHSNKRMAALVDAMLTVSNLELGALPVHPEPVDLPALSHQVIEAQLQALPGRKNLHITEIYDKSLPPLTFDLEISKMILNNLVTNAIKYTPAKGKISIAIRRSQERLAVGSADNVLLEVSDTGAGIPKKQQSQIFTKLFRADNIKRKDTDGTGLGLYIVKTVTEYIGGRMWFKSVENKGSTFSVLLPLAMKARLDEAFLRQPPVKKEPS